MAEEPICIFEDPGWSRLEPLTSVRPVFALRLGVWTLRERIEKLLAPAASSLACRRALAGSVAEDHPGTRVNEIAFDPCLFVNGRVVADATLGDALGGDEDRLYVAGDEVVAARVSGARLEALRPRLGEPLDASVWDGLPVENVEARLVRHLWDLVRDNPGQIARDFERLAPHLEPGEPVPEEAHVVEPDGVYLGHETRVAPGVVLDASAGPILLGPKVDVRANTVIQGPAVIGGGSLLQPLTLLEGATVGPVCRLGGEIRDCVIHGYSNKQHAGFLGHAYLGEWVNLGAETTNSDLKNNYSTVRVAVDGRQVETGEVFVGCFIGDHTKTAIGSRINTGSVFGSSCLLYAPGFLPKYVPPFTWLGNDGPVRYSLDKALETARAVMARRGVKMTRAREAVLRSLHERTEGERTGTRAAP